MDMKNIFQFLGLLTIVVSFSGNIEAAHHKDALLDAVNNPERNVNYSARDNYRNPYETLSFFQIKPTMHVLELSAGGGWYTEILAPYLEPLGKLSVTHHNPEAGGYYKRSRNSYDEKVKSNPLF
jgi:predicted methyltransferase